MAEEILVFKVDQGDLLKEAATSKKAISELRGEVKGLNEAFKAGEVDAEEYYKEQVRLEGALKKETQTYNNLNKALNANANSLDAIRARVTRLNAERNKLDRSTVEGAKKFDMLTKELKELNEQLNKNSKAAGQFKDNIGNYPEIAEQANVATAKFGGSVDDLTTKFGAFLSPVGAAVGLVGALGTAYAASEQGARDLAFASDLVTSALRRSVDSFGKFIDTVAGGDGQDAGIFSQLTFVALQFIPFIDSAQALADANNQRILRDLQISQRLAVGFAKDYERLAENARRVRDDEEKTFDQRLKAADEVNEQLTANQQIRIAVLQQTINAIKESTSEYETNRDAQAQVAELSSEIRDIQEEINGKLTENVTARRAILKLVAEQADIERRNARAVGRQGTVDFADTTGTELSTDARVSSEIDANAAILASKENLAKDIISINKRLQKSEEQRIKDGIRIQREQDRARVVGASIVAGEISGIFEEGSEIQKFFALISIGADTAEAIASLTSASEGNPANAFTFGGAGIAQFATGLARIFANIAFAKDFLGSGFAGGGYTGSGFGLPDKTGFKPAGIVHEGEYVAPKRVIQNPGSQPHIAALERLRLGSYADGGQVVAAQATEPINQSLITANAIKRMPAPVIGVREYERVAERVRVKESVTRR